MVMIGRNSPCPCGSGKKHKKCCLGKDNVIDMPAVPATRLPLHIKEYLQNTSFENFEDLQGKLTSIQSSHNAAPNEDFLGLSPDHIHRCLYQPYENTKDIVCFNSDISSEIIHTAPIVQAAHYLMTFLAEQGPVKATATGNLPRKLVRQTYEYLANPTEAEESNISSEANVPILGVLRGILTREKFISEIKGKFSVTDCGAHIVENGFQYKEFMQLLKHYTMMFNWGFFDRHEELRIIQNSFLFLLYVLHKEGQESISCVELAKIYERAFPAIIKEIPQDEYSSKRVKLGRLLQVRFIKRFCIHFGFVDIVGELESFISKVNVKTSRLFDEFFHWAD